ncbi:hypothetical protein FHS21_002790 [Phyllobacterium trifolii]|uniref:Uncharacterized protein n=1 Tax=Phyllobacterium trifolii TaxID=300193 RepID=A0A839U8S2_9HYPH|nr:hypothetical protein [Phyllobacterium trifolii]
MRLMTASPARDTNRCAGSTLTLQASWWLRSCKEKLQSVAGIPMRLGFEERELSVRYCKYLERCVEVVIPHF